jgi:CRISPR/Cas system-associated protein Csx1
MSTTLNGKNMNKKIKNLLLFMILYAVCATTCFAQTGLKISIDSLPEPVKEQLHQKYHGYSIASILRETLKNGEIAYLLNIQRDKNASVMIVYHLIYDSEGNLLSKKKEKEYYYTGNEKKSTPITPSRNQGGHQH